ncbi:hypothetical protein T265_03923 [Opisthorchis viverrini]|uniref:Uncharacterized protein n=1 Tax=Opisthorchis viverrini TaxID=6198 RepID=A0A074ZUD3_OPIVI|nr:hypothetical protein T265_03923 [Opisthorchis viverrini]KER29457.1 hypothetical protein T265_03923 [Opisthorchis viverrini]
MTNVSPRPSSYIKSTFQRVNSNERSRVLSDLHCEVACTCISLLPCRKSPELESRPIVFIKNYFPKHRVSVTYSVHIIGSTERKGSLSVVLRKRSRINDEKYLYDILMAIIHYSAVTPFRRLAVMPPEGRTRAGILPSCPNLDRGSPEAEVRFEPLPVSKVVF